MATVIKMKPSGTEIACKDSWYLIACAFLGNENGRLNWFRVLTAGYRLLSKSSINPLG